MTPGAAETVLAGAVLCGAWLGAAMAWSGFCTMGAVADLTLMGDGRRLRAWILAAAMATACHAAVLTVCSDSGFSSPRIDYAGPAALWARQAIGGVMFGAGMTLAGGCVSRHLVRAGAGSGKAVVTLLVVGITAWAMTATPLYLRLFAPWLDPLVLDLRRFGYPDQTLPTLVGFGAAMTRPTAGFGLAALLAVFALAGARLGRSRAQLAGGLAVGFGVGAGWWLTIGPVGQAWTEGALFAAAPPPGLGAQSFTFVAPLADLVRLVTRRDLAWFTFGAAGAGGVVAGAAGHAVVKGRFRLEWFAGAGDAARHAAGAVLMGAGGVLALGCTIGQGVTGISTLAAGSLVAVAAIVAGEIAVLKIELART